MSENLGYIKGGKANSCGTKMWIAQRVSAIALIPLVIWFVIFMFEAVATRNMDQLFSIFTSPFPTVLLAVFIITSIYHGAIGMIEIIEDYIHCSTTKIFLILFIKFFSSITAIAGACASLVLHLSTFVFN